MRDLFLLTIKPMMYIANVNEDGFGDNPQLEAVASTPRRKAPRWCRLRRHRGGDAHR